MRQHGREDKVERGKNIYSTLYRIPIFNYIRQSQNKRKHAPVNGARRRRLRRKRCAARALRCARIIRALPTQPDYFLFWDTVPVGSLPFFSRVFLGFLKMVGMIRGKTVSGADILDLLSCPIPIHFHPAPLSYDCPTRRTHRIDVSKLTRAGRDALALALERSTSKITGTCATDDELLEDINDELLATEVARIPHPSPSRRGQKLVMPIMAELPLFSFFSVNSSICEGLISPSSSMLLSKKAFCLGPVIMKLAPPGVKPRPFIIL